MAEQYSHAELLLALEVRIAASSLRRQSIPEHLKFADDAASQAELDEWLVQHPLSDYYTTVVDEVVGSAEAIRRFMAT